MHVPAEDRYESMPYRRCGRSGLKLPAVSLGAWETFGGYRGEDVARACLLRAFDLGVTHFDLANNYGTPNGNAEVVVGRVLQELPRDELIISSKAGWDMWPGPYGDHGSKKYLVASCDQSLQRLGLDYVDIFYHHRPDPETPLEETLGALDLLVRQGKALYVGVSSYRGAQYADAVRIAERHGLAPITIHQPNYSLLDRWIEGDLLPLTERFGSGVIVFAPLASGILTDRYLDGSVPHDHRAAWSWGDSYLGRLPAERRVAVLHGLAEVARERGQSLAQLAIAWTLRLGGVTSALMGASSVEQVEANVAAVQRLGFADDELRRLDELLGVV